MALFEATHDKHGIWYPRFYNSTRAAVDEYIVETLQLNDRIRSRELPSRRPLAILWDLTDQNLPALQRMILMSKRHPPPPDLIHHVAFIAGNKTVINEVNVLTKHIEEHSKIRRYFLVDQREAALQWLINSTEFVPVQKDM
ncbi:MAG: hypothetical protein AAFQ07_15780 [Chloroflexota bacterium]